jgi:phospholipase/lecithinase/hemolysin
LSDTGNDIVLTKAQGIFPAIPPSESPHRTYYNGRFSNGPVSVEYLWRLLKSSNNAVLTPFLSKNGLTLDGGINFAFGGSTSGYVNQTPGRFYVPGVLGQVELFRKALKGKKPQADALYVIWTGANDYITGATDQPAEVVANITKAVETLYSLGARNFLVPNLPDLGLAPIIQSEGSEKIQEFSQFTETHNDLLERAGSELKIKLRGSSIIIVDLYTVSQNLLSNGIPPTSEHIIIAPPALAVIAAGTEAVSCLFTDPTACPDVKVTEAVPPFYFWDVLHPTTLIHRFFGQAMFNSLKNQDSLQSPTGP